MKGREQGRKEAGAMEDRGWGRKDPGCYGGRDGGRRGGPGLDSQGAEFVLTLFGASLVAQLVKNLPVMHQTQV